MASKKPLVSVGGLSKVLPASTDLDVGSSKLVNVATGTASTDAANVGQLAYQAVQADTTPVTPARPSVNFSPFFAVTDNGTNHSTDVDLQLASITIDRLASGDLGALLGYNTGDGSASEIAIGTNLSITGSTLNALQVLQYLSVQEQFSSGTNASTNVAGSNTRALNTVVANLMTGASLSSNLVTIPAGVYYLKGFAQAFQAFGPGTGGSQLSVFNTTTSTRMLVGSSVSNAVTGTPGAATATFTSTVSGQITLGATSALRLDHFIANVVTNGLGAASSSGWGEVYSGLEIWRLHD